jgi:hypothetical protein
LCHFLSRGVLEELSVDFVSRKLNVSNDGASDEAALHGEHVRVLLRIGDADVGQLSSKDCRYLKNHFSRLLITYDIGRWEK